jgi:hypothetical protein
MCYELNQNDQRPEQKPVVAPIIEDDGLLDDDGALDELESEDELENEEDYPHNEDEALEDVPAF